MSVALFINGIECHKIKQRSGVNKEAIENYGSGAENSPPPVCFLTFEEGSGTEAADESESATDHDADVDASATWDGAVKAAGSYSIGLDSGETVEIADHADHDWAANTEWTISAYVKIPLGDSSYRGVYSKRMTGTPSASAWRGVAIFSASGNPEVYIVWHWGNPSIPGDDASIFCKGVTGQTTTMNTGNLMHVLCTYDGSTSSAGIKLWLDGVLHTVANGKLMIGSAHDTLSVSDTVTNSIDVHLGNDSASTSYNCDNVDHVALWKDVNITDEQAELIHNSGTPIDVARGL